MKESNKEAESEKQEAVGTEGDNPVPIEPELYQAPTKKPDRFKRPAKYALITIGILLLLVAVGYGFWRYYLNKPPSGQSEQASTDQSAGQQTAEPEQASELTETYISDRLRMEFMHPDGWTITEAEGGVRVESPDFNFVTMDEGDISGNFKIYLRKGAQDIDGKYIGRGVAIAPSQQIDYSEPEPGQREQTFLTDFGIDESDNFGLFIVQGNFDLKKGDTLGPDFAKETDAYLIAGGYGSVKLKDDLATNKVAVDYYNASGAYKTAVEIIKSLKIR